MKTIQNASNDNPALVPFTESCYLHVQIVDKEKFLINIGGGYLAELSKEDALKFFDGRSNNRKAELNKVRQALGHNQLTRE